MDEELTLLKNEIKQVLLEIQEHVLNIQNPFSSGPASMSMGVTVAAVPAAAASEPVFVEPVISDPEPAPAAAAPPEVAVVAEVAAPVAAPVAAAPVAAPGGFPLHIRTIDHQRHLVFLHYVQIPDGSGNFRRAVDGQHAQHVDDGLFFHAGVQQPDHHADHYLYFPRDRVFIFPALAAAGNFYH